MPSSPSPAAGGSWAVGHFHHRDGPYPTSLPFVPRQSPARRKSRLHSGSSGLPEGEGIMRRDRNGLLALTLIVGCTAVPQEFTDSPTPLQEQMYAHFQEALELRAGAIFGEIERIRTAGEFLSDEESMPAMPRGSERYLDVLREAGTEAAYASDDEGRLAAAEVARTCGLCHQRYEVGPRFVVGMPTPGESVATHMARQARVSRLLWDGLIGPSDVTWAAGALELAQGPEFPPEVAQMVPDRTLPLVARARLETLGTRAEMTTDPVERAALLADVWGVCAGCHVASGVEGPPR